MTLPRSIFAICLLLVLAECTAYIANESRPQVLQYEMETANMPNSYKFHYDASDGSSRTEHGAILNPGTKDSALDVAGAVRWYDDKGHLYEMTYKAGKRGYRTIIKKLS
ncbi:endocuticle structural glycoprotein SgAbd-9 [Pieris rapae]|nr:endocuticle structural glycoprotein SgAbd-9 [Pieris rapae]